MTKPTAETPAITCPRCGETGSGRFCTSCGSALRGVACASCGEAIPAGALFCPSCGAGTAAPTARVPVLKSGGERLSRIVGGAALLVLVAFVAGVVSGRRSAGSARTDDTVRTPLADAPAGVTGGGTAPDISSMTPEERASRLFNRVMMYSEQGKTDSARFFAPMAIQAYEMMGPVDAHAQYDIGVISAAAGDVTRARAEADSILAKRGTHLFGLILAIRAANMAGDAAGASRYRQRLIAAAPAERPALKEYAEHARDIDEALRKASEAR